MQVDKNMAVLEHGTVRDAQAAENRKKNESR